MKEIYKSLFTPFKIGNVKIKNRFVMCPMTGTAIINNNEFNYEAEKFYLERAKNAKVDSFWYKDISPEALIEVIDRTMEGEHLFPDKTPNVKLGLADSSELTLKEIEVLRLVCEGLEYGEIAESLGVSERTVKYHISNILSKTGYANKTRLAIAVTNQKFIIPKL